jgi:CheY-like chemotaxis protein
MPQHKSSTILLADEDPEDCLLIRDAIQEAGFLHDLHMVHDGEQLMDYMFQRGAYSNELDAPRPALILLDLKMPKKDGREALAEIKAAPAWRRIPIVILTTSHADRDIDTCYDLGANSFISKPVTYTGLVDLMRQLNRYWFQTVELADS